MGELRLRGARERQNRGWTPQILADALAQVGSPISRRTLARGCASGAIPHHRTTGGHIRIDPAWVALMFPSVLRLGALAEDEVTEVALGA